MSSYYGSSILVFLTTLSGPSCPVMSCHPFLAVVPWVIYPGCPVIAVLKKPACHGYPVKSCPATVFLSWQSCNGCPVTGVLPVLPWLPFSQRALPHYGSTRYPIRLSPEGFSLREINFGNPQSRVQKLQRFLCTKIARFAICWSLFCLMLKSCRQPEGDTNKYLPGLICNSDKETMCWIPCK